MNSEKKSKNFLKNPKETPVIRDIFTVGLTERGFLANQSFSRIAITRGDAWDPMLGFIFSIIYLYGGEIRGIYPACTKRVSKKWSGVLGYTRSPWLLFEFRNAPFLTRENQVKIIGDKILQEGMDFLAPYYWIDEIGESLRKNINPLLQKSKKTKSFKDWEKGQLQWKKVMGKWHDMFYATYKKQFDFSLKLYEYQSHLAITIKDDIIETVSNSNELKHRQSLHQELITDFATFLYDGFLNKKKGFGKCLYE